MSERSWIPGPWAVDPDDRPGMAYNRHIVLANDPNQRICFMAHDGLEGDHAFKATAYLIAAAPELYDAIVAILDVDASPAARSPGAFHEVFEQAREALAKSRAWPS